MAFYTAELKTLVASTALNGTATQSTIAAVVNCANSTVFRWKWILDGDGVLTDTKTGGDMKSQRLLQHMDFIVGVIRDKGGKVPHSKIVQELREKKQERFCIETIRQFRIKHDLPRKQGKTVVGRLPEPGQTPASVAADPPAAPADAAAPADSKLATRLKLIEQVVFGKQPVQDACDDLDVKVDTGYHWLRQFKCDLQLKPCNWGGSRWTKDIAEHGEEIRTQTANGATPEEIVEWLQTEKSVGFSVSTVRKVVQKNKIAPHQSDAAAAKADADTGAGAADADAPGGDAWLAAECKSQGVPRHIVDKLYASMGDFQFGFRNVFGLLPDSLLGNAKKFTLALILFICLYSTTAGQDNAAAAAQFIAKRWPHMRRFMGADLPAKPPKRVTINNALRAYADREAYEVALSLYLQGLAATRGVPLRGVDIMLDGKSANGSNDENIRKKFHSLGAMIHTPRFWLAMMKSSPLKGEAETTELMLKNKLVPIEDNDFTGDGSFFTEAICRLIIQNGGGYCLSIRKNQRRTYEAVLQHISQTEPLETCVETDSKRKDWTRKVEYYPLPEWLQREINHPGLVAVALYTVNYPEKERKKKEREEKRKREEEERMKLEQEQKEKEQKGSQELELSSQSDTGKAEGKNPAAEPDKGNDDDKQEFTRLLGLSKEYGADRTMGMARDHWGGEVGHNDLDVHFNEDGHRARKGSAPQVWGGTRRIGANLMRQANTGNSLPLDMDRCLMEPFYHLAVLTQFANNDPEVMEFFNQK